MLFAVCEGESAAGPVKLEEGEMQCTKQPGPVGGRGSSSDCCEICTACIYGTIVERKPKCSPHAPGEECGAGALQQCLFHFSYVVASELIHIVVASSLRLAGADCLCTAVCSHSSFPLFCYIDPVAEVESRVFTPSAICSVVRGLVQK